MKIRTIAIQNFKSFNSDQTLISDLSDLNIFVGKNNSGKSNVLRALDLFFNGAYSGNSVLNADDRRGSIDRNVWYGNKVNEKIIIKLDLIFDDSDYSTLLSGFSGNFTSYLSDNYDIPLTVWLELTANPNATSATSTITKILHGATLLFERMKDGRINAYSFSHGGLQDTGNQKITETLRGLLSSQYKIYPALMKADINVAEQFEKFRSNYLTDNTEIYEKINTQLSKLFPSIISTSTYFYTRDQEIHFKTNNLNLPTSSYGEGIEQIFMILFKIYSEKNKIIAIEEPESHLHPPLFRKVIKLLKNISKEDGIQFFITTHSAVAITPEDLSMVYRCQDTGEGTKISKLSNHDNAKLNKLESRLNPDSGEMFFADKVILVEGPEDKFFLEGLIKKKNIANDAEIKMIFVGGKSFDVYLEILKSFNIPYAIICDNECLTAQRPKIINEILKSDPKLTDTDKQRSYLRKFGIRVISGYGIEDHYPERFNISGKDPMNALKVLSDLNDDDLRGPKMQELITILREVILRS